MALAVSAADKELLLSDRNTGPLTHTLVALLPRDFELESDDVNETEVVS